MVGEPSSSRKPPFDDRRKAELVEMIGATLRTQLLIQGTSIPDLANPDGSKALGYVYGFVDAALRSVGQDMAKMDIGPPVTYQVLRAVFDDDANRYLQWLQMHIGESDLMMAGVMSGGQQFVDWQSGKLEMPMGLARFVLESQDKASLVPSSPPSQPPSAVDAAEAGERWAMPVRAVIGLPFVETIWRTVRAIYPRSPMPMSKSIIPYDVGIALLAIIVAILLPASPLTNGLTFLIATAVLARYLTRSRAGYLRRRAHWTRASWRRFLTACALPAVACVLCVGMVTALESRLPIVGAAHSATRGIWAATTMAFMVVGVGGLAFALELLESGDASQQFAWPHWPSRTLR